ncbi:MAG: hypothetical protein AB1762_16380, partial [Gemmatimonadota bacterium]
RDPTVPMRQGTSLSRIGYPFNDVKVTRDPATQQYAFQHISVPIFPIEGILTRQIDAGQHPLGYQEGYIETSSPGLKGQSGGPILDTKGRVWGIQSRTLNLSLGFDPEVPAEDGKKPKRREHQFLNVGWGTRPEAVVGLLREVDVSHQVGA